MSARFATGRVLGRGRERLIFLRACSAVQLGHSADSKQPEQHLGESPYSNEGEVEEKGTDEEEGEQEEEEEEGGPKLLLSAVVREILPLLIIASNSLFL